MRERRSGSVDEADEEEAESGASEGDETEEEAVNGINVDLGAGRAEYIKGWVKEHRNF